MSGGGLDVVIVTYNSLTFIGDCLESLANYPPSLMPMQVWVVDNASSDGTAAYVRQHFPAVQVIENRRNLGFAGGCNSGIRASAGEYVLLLNPDARVSAGALDVLLSYMARFPQAGAAGPLLFGEDGEVQPSCRSFPTLRAVALRGLGLDRLFPSSRLLQRYLLSDWDHREARPVDWVLGACMLLRRQALERVGLFDEGFFMYYEDIDWCLRAKREGWQIHYVPQARVAHVYQRGSARGVNRLLFYHIKSIVRLFWKHRLPL